MSSLCNSPLEKVEKACDGRGRHSSETFEPGFVHVQILQATSSHAALHSDAMAVQILMHGQQSRAPHGGGLTSLLQLLMRDGKRA